jgi:hypothetical protein
VASTEEKGTKMRKSANDNYIIPLEVELLALEMAIESVFGSDVKEQMERIVPGFYEDAKFIVEISKDIDLSDLEPIND